MSGLRAALVGAGGMGRAWARTLTENKDVSLVAWVDVLEERVAEGITELGLTDLAVKDDVEAALTDLAPDFVVDVAVPEAHHDITRRCLQRRVAVLGEKPMAATLDEARDLVRLSEQYETLFVVSQNRRYNTGLTSFKQLAAGRLGRLGQLNAEFYRAPHFGGFRDEMESPLLIDMAIHTFDAARYVTGADPHSVLCTEFNPSWSWYRGAASAVAEFEFTGGLRFSYQGSWCAQGLETSWDSSWRAIGELGTATWDGSGHPVAEALPPDGHGLGSPANSRLQRTEAPPAEIAGEGIAGSLNDFVRALRTGLAPMNECHDNILSLAMVMGALESSRSGRRVPVKA